MRSERGRLRVLVIQVLVFSLFATLFARLYYLQVVTGADYRTQAASQSVREVVVQPQRLMRTPTHRVPGTRNDLKLGHICSN